jgi:hypothetical protein
MENKGSAYGVSLALGCGFSVKIFKYVNKIAQTVNVIGVSGAFGWVNVSEVDHSNSNNRSNSFGIGGRRVH